MKTSAIHELALEKLLAGTPARVLDRMTSGDPELRREVDHDAEVLASLALSLDPVAPSATVRARLAAVIDGAPSNTRRSAVLVVDMLVDHLTPGVPLEVPRARAVVPAVQRRLEQARRDGEPVIYLVDHHEPGDPELDAWPMHNVREPLDDIWPALKPAASDTVITHRTYSGFRGTKLDDVLRGLDVNTVVVTGCITEIHLFATATDALMHGYHVEVPVECQAGASPESEQMILNTLSIMAPTQPFGG